MKSFLMAFTLFVVVLSAYPASALPNDGRSSEAALEGAGALDAVAIANQWKWSKKDVKSYVNSREVVFQFPDGKVKKIPLPEKKMVVAVAPYAKGTHT